MSVDNSNNEIAFICDECGDSYTGGFEEPFGDVLAEIKMLGWWIEKEEDGTYSHYCPNCQDGPDLPRRNHRRA